MESVYEEFIRFDKDFRENKNAFYGKNSPLDEEAKKEFLRHYAQYAKKRYGDDACFRKAVDGAAAEAAEQSLSLDKGAFYDVYKRDKKRTFENWSFYTARATAENGYVLLNDNYSFPVPCAKYDLPSGIKEFTFAVYIDMKYFCARDGVSPTTTGRFIEFRQDCTEVIKLCFAPDGTFANKDGSVKPYHYNVTNLGKYVFDGWNEIKIVFCENDFELTFGGNIFKLPYSNKVRPDNMFLGGGMQPVSFWRFKPIRMKAETEVIADFFRPSETAAAREEFIGKKQLPVVLGTKENKDKELILRRTVCCDKTYAYRLKVHALDPGGAVYINGKEVAKKDDFQPFTTDITPYVKEGENLLEIVVFPRAPETLYPWHRHDDYYNGWFCLDVETEESKEFGIGEPIVTTSEVGETTRFNVKATAESKLYGKEYGLYLTKIHPEQGVSVLLKKAVLSGNIDEDFEMPVSLWSVEDPNLYNLSAEVYDKDGVCCRTETEVGFRTVEQKNGGIYINGIKTVLKGALNMLFLPPYDEIPLNHVCPSDGQIAEQVLAVKSMNGNCLRLHQLGYGCGDRRFARICDRLGILLIWTTRLIDSAENVKWTGEWKHADGYKMQMREVINSPSVVMWEGSNEFHGELEHIDSLYDGFVRAVKEADESRLICPVSHLYYGGGLYDGAHYYSDCGDFDENGNAVRSSYGWIDENVVRSAHTYCLLLGYGEPWERMVNQDWDLQKELFDNDKRAYLVSEYAVIGRQNPETEEAKAFINKDSYELPDENNALGFVFTDDEWEISQAYQAVCASLATKQLVKNGADGMLWCCLSSGANNASYLKPIIDFYGYTKLAYYSLSEGFQSTVVMNEKPDILTGDDYEIQPILCGAENGKRYKVKVTVSTENGEIIKEKEYSEVLGDGLVKLEPFRPKFTKNGYYTIRYSVKEKTA